MTEPARQPDAVAIIENLANRVRRLESALARASVIHHYTTATLPPASQLPGSIVFLEDTGQHQKSNGSSWTTF